MNLQNIITYLATTENDGVPAVVEGATMSASVITAIVFGSIFALLVLIAIFATFYSRYLTKKRNKKNGRADEKRINSILQNFASSHNKKFISSKVYSYVDSDKKKKYFESDGILIDQNVIVCVEIKSVSGSIYGNATDSKLSVKNSREYSIANPIIQNDRHIEHLKNMLKTDFPIHSLIIFSNRTQTTKINSIPVNTSILSESQLSNGGLDKLFDEILIDKINVESSQEWNNIYQTITNSEANDADLNKFYEITGRFN